MTTSELDDILEEYENGQNPHQSEEYRLNKARAALLTLKKKWQTEAEELMGEAVIARMRQSNYQWEKAESFIQTYQMQKTDDVHGIFPKLTAQGGKDE